MGHSMKEALTLSICKTLSLYRFNYASEIELQNGIETILGKANFNYKRELRLSGKDIVDFLVFDETESVVIEVKIDGSRSALLRQVSRYVLHENVSAVLVVGSPHWVSGLPSEIHGKPLCGYRLLGSLL